MSTRDHSPADLLLVRHGATPWNLEGRWQGQTDIALADVGRAEARHAAEQLVGRIDAVTSSDLRRASETAAIVAEVTSARVLEPWAELRERFAGPWEGMTRDDIASAWPGYLEAGTRPPGYEADADVLGRTLPAVLAIGAAARARRETVAVVSHGGVIGTLLRSLGVAAPHLGQLCGAWLGLDVGEEGAHLRYVLDFDPGRPPEPGRPAPVPI